MPPDLIEKGWELGYLQASIPEGYDGFGDRSAITGVLAAEEMAYGDLSGALAVMTPGLFATPILLVGSEEQKTKYIPPVIEMEWKPFTAALMESRLNYDPNELSTKAELDGDHYVISGEKSYIPFAADAEMMIVYADLDGQYPGIYRPRWMLLALKLGNGRNFWGCMPCLCILPILNLSAFPWKTVLAVPKGTILPQF